MSIEWSGVCLLSDVAYEVKEISGGDNESEFKRHFYKHKMSLRKRNWKGGMDVD